MKPKAQTEPSHHDLPSGNRSGDVVIGYNPASGAGDRTAKVQELAKRLRGAGLNVFVSDSIEESVQTTTALFRAGTLRAYVCGGGDGTLRTMAELLPKGVPIVIFPMGTENLLARYFGIDGRMERVERSVREGELQWIDAGIANGKMFLVMASCGFDADVVKRVHGRRKGHIQRWSYFLPAWESIWNYSFSPLHVTTGEGEQLQDCRWAFVFNVPRYAMDLKIAPEADPLDGKLDLCTFRRGNLLLGLAYIGAILIGRHRQWTSSQSRQSETLRIEADRPVPYQLDGDPGGELPVEMAVLPRRVCLLI